jgi:hypothetical protein
MFGRPSGALLPEASEALISLGMAFPNAAALGHGAGAFNRSVRSDRSLGSVDRSCESRSP